MLDELIAARSARQDHGRRIALRLQRIARVVVMPASALMMLGLIWYAAVNGAPTAPAGHSVTRLNELFTRTALTPLGAMSAGLLALALLPMVNVLYILLDSLLVKRWADAAVAAVVAGILILGIILGRA